MAGPDTIVAVSSPAGAADTGVVRLSGPAARAIAARVLESPGYSLARAPRGAYPAFYAAAPGRLVPTDVWVMESPRSFTGEDVAEIHLPGAPALLAQIIGDLRAAGARPAEAGEFTRRAFLNGRIDLAQAEAVAALIRSTSEADRRAAVALLDGGAGRRLEAIANRIVAVLALLELDLDFSDQDVEIAETGRLVPEILAIREALRALSAAESRSTSSAATVVVLTGPANAGKSSLFNALLERDEAIVSPHPGTTRDVLEGVLEDGGFAVTILDTAGDDHTGGEADRLAHRMRERALAAAEILVLVHDGRMPAEGVGDGIEALRVHTHADLVPERHRCSGFWVSSVTRAGVAEFKREILRRARGGDHQGSPLAHLRERHRECFARAFASLERGASALALSSGKELAAADLQEALRAVREITGADYGEAVLDRVMRDFCIGK